MATVLSGSTDGVYLLQDTKGRTYIKGLNDTRKKFLEMGGDRNLFEKWIKQAAQIGANEAKRTAPRITGKLANSVKGYASKTVNIKNKSTGAIDRRMVFGGVITAGSGRDRKTKTGGVTTTGVQYARATSLGMFHVAGERSVAGDRVWRTTVRGRGNPYMVKAREKKKPLMVQLLNYQLAQYIRKKGFKTNGL
jgi:hypothetical protein